MFFQSGTEGILSSVRVALGGHGGRVTIQRVERRVPAEGGALDARGESVDAGEGGDVADLVKAAFVVSDLADDVPYTSNAFSLFADLILYDMLHTYVQSYFVVSGATGEFSVDSLHQKHDEDLIQGLDEAQRELIYNKFRKVPWLDRTRPPVDGYRDLLKYWGGHFTPGPEKECYGHMQ